MSNGLVHTSLLIVTHNPTPLPAYNDDGDLGLVSSNYNLDPARLDHGRYPLLAYTSHLPLRVSPCEDLPLSEHMPPNTRTQAEGSQRPARLPNGYVDLTATSDSPPRRRKHGSTSPGPSNKRRKQSDDTPVRRDGLEVSNLDQVDLTNGPEAMLDILPKQRADASKVQDKADDTRTTFNNFNCVICMDTPTDLTATACGTFSRYIYGQAEC